MVAHEYDFYALPMVSTATNQIYKQSQASVARAGVFVSCIQAIVAYHVALEYQVSQCKTTLNSLGLIQFSSRLPSASSTHAIKCVNIKQCDTPDTAVQLGNGRND